MKVPVRHPDGTRVWKFRNGVSSDLDFASVERMVKEHFKAKNIDVFLYSTQEAFVVVEIEK